MVDDPTSSAMLTAKGFELEAPLVALWDPLLFIASELYCYQVTTCVCRLVCEVIHHLIGQFQNCPVYKLQFWLQLCVIQMCLLLCIGATAAADLVQTCSYQFSINFRMRTLYQNHRIRSAV